MHLQDTILIEACLLKVSVYITGDYEVFLLLVGKLFQYIETSMRNDITVHLQTVPIETPE